MQSLNHSENGAIHLTYHNSHNETHNLQDIPTLLTQDFVV